MRLFVICILTLSCFSYGVDWDNVVAYDDNRKKRRQYRLEKPQNQYKTTESRQNRNAADSRQSAKIYSDSTGLFAGAGLLISDEMKFGLYDLNKNNIAQWSADMGFGVSVASGYKWLNHNAYNHTNKFGGRIYGVFEYHNNKNKLDKLLSYDMFDIRAHFDLLWNWINDEDFSLGMHVGAGIGVWIASGNNSAVVGIEDNPYNNFDALTTDKAVFVSAPITLGLRSVLLERYEVEYSAIFRPTPLYSSGGIFHFKIHNYVSHSIRLFYNF